MQGRRPQSALLGGRWSLSTRPDGSSPRRKRVRAKMADFATPSGLLPPPSPEEMGITFRPVIRITYVTTLRNRLSEPVEKTPVSRNSEPDARKATSGRVHSDSVGPGPDSEISGSAPGFRFRRAAAAPDAHGFRHAFGKTAITFRPGIGIAYMTTFRNRHLEALVVLDRQGDQTPFSSPKSIASASEISVPAGDSHFLAATSPGSRGSPAGPPPTVGPSRQSMVAVDAARRLLPAS
ncbi:hypothetical protein Taro_056652 [Colocasia esculenta]|uniref:Uncharacterized protein n=1 Tax=Colocasia esculenta TaxID=4460 RepID=A0A843XWE2_COLES|nr:hypothetical protein [Colocasia esculenta]